MGGRWEGSSTARRWLGLAILALMLVTVGCLGGSSPEAGEALNETATDEAPQPDAATASTNETGTSGLRFPGPTTETTVNETGTFSAGDGAFAGGGIRGTDTREHDLTSQIPRGAPVTINVSITYDGETSQLNAWWALENVEVFDLHYRKDFATNTLWLEASLARTSSGGSVVAVVQADSVGEAPERSYELEATIRSHGDATLPAVPTSIPVTEASGGFALAPADGGGSMPGVTVWTPDGTRQRLQPTAGSVRMSLDEGDSTGRYTVIVGEPEQAEGVPETQLSVRPANESQAPEGPLEVVPAKLQTGSWRTVDPGSTVEWSFEQDPAPIRVGMRARPAQPASATGPGSLDVELASPAGTVVEESFAGFYVGQFQIWWTTDVGDPKLVAGSYNATASLPPGALPWDVSHVVWSLQLP